MKIFVPVKTKRLKLKRREGKEEKVILKKDAMNNLKKQFKIVVVEDNEFYNNILTRQLKNFTEGLAIDRGLSFEIDSYTNAHDFLRNLKKETDIAILDYYLGDSLNGAEILKAIKKKCEHCKVVIISQLKNIKTYYQTLNEGAYHFIHKDRNALSNSCTVVEDIINESNESP